MIWWVLYSQIGSTIDPRIAQEQIDWLIVLDYDTRNMCFDLREKLVDPQPSQIKNLCYDLPPSEVHIIDLSAKELPCLL